MSVGYVLVALFFFTYSLLFIFMFKQDKTVEVVLVQDIEPEDEPIEPVEDNLARWRAIYDSLEPEPASGFDKWVKWIQKRGHTLDELEYRVAKVDARTKYERGE